VSDTRFEGILIETYIDVCSFFSSIEIPLNLSQDSACNLQMNDSVQCIYLEILLNKSSRCTRKPIYLSQNLRVNYNGTVMLDLCEEVNEYESY
jgi:hypothetical protein